MAGCAVDIQFASHQMDPLVHAGKAQRWTMFCRGGSKPIPSSRTASCTPPSMPRNNTPTFWALAWRAMLRNAPCATRKRHRAGSGGMTTGRSCNFRSLGIDSCRENRSYSALTASPRPRFSKTEGCADRTTRECLRSGAPGHPARRRMISPAESPFTPLSSRPASIANPGESLCQIIMQFASEPCPFLLLRMDEPAAQAMGCLLGPATPGPVHQQDDD